MKVTGQTESGKKKTLQTDIFTDEEFILLKKLKRGGVDVKVHLLKSAQRDPFEKLCFILGEATWAVSQQLGMDHDVFIEHLSQTTQKYHGKEVRKRS